MIVYFITVNKIRVLHLPLNISGSYWITDKNQYSDDINVVNVAASSNKWIIKSNANYQIFLSNSFQKEVELVNYKMFNVAKETEIIGQIWASPINETTYKAYNIKISNEINIGKASSQDIIYNINFFAKNQLRMVNNANSATIYNLDVRVPLYVNYRRVNQSTLKCGDIIFICGLKIIYMTDFIIINNPLNLVQIKQNMIPFHNINNYADIKEQLEIELYKEKDYYLQKPRLITRFKPVKIDIDSPPTKDEEEEKPAIYTIGPMVTMGLVSVAMLLSSISGVINDGKSLSSSMTTIIMSVAMLATMLLWPTLSNRYDKKMKQRYEKKRQEKYRKYLVNKSDEISILMNQEKQIIIENTYSIDACTQIILKKDMHLWEREIEHFDFLSIRLGIGNQKPSIEINYPEEHFSLSEDNLKELLLQTVEKNNIITSVPITTSLVEHNKLALIGDSILTLEFIDSMILQIATLHSYQDVKIVLFTNDNNKEWFDYLKVLPHVFNDERTERYYCVNIDDIKQVASDLEQIYNSRKYTDDQEEINEFDYKNYSPYYVIFVDNPKIFQNLNLIHSILNDNINYGFSLVFRGTDISGLPNECSTFIDISGKEGDGSGIFENFLESDNQKQFKAELNNNKRINMYNYAQILANIPLKMEKVGAKGLPKMISFLEMYKVGNLQQLNILNRWISNNPIISLAAAVGVDESGELFKLDLHEKFHGPHGLIAGMTGSGKSEFIITYVLSLAINYHPYEVQFVLIDYKGGGLAGAFENKTNGLKLPHIAGTITNLDIVEMNRALNSIQSELRRRQTIFNEAKTQTNEGTMDIYKYQKLYRNGQVKEPVSHLFIISDEFAELKMQQPDFMDQLISTARIGRSLGVHLILATQKPSGIVNDQIWSNSRFKVCLKVQDKADSMDMLKCPDAASLKDVGRFYLQVGYNEFFALGQSAWTGAPYFPAETVQKNLNTSIDFIDNIGYIIKSDEDDETKEKIESKGEQLINIVKYLSDLAKENNIKINRLWLSKIPAEIFVNDLKEKYNYEKVDYYINPILGEYDDPNNQKQGLLTLDLSKKGNTLIYGISGSGIDGILNTIVYSTITTYGPKEVNFYLLDFGTESLNSFKKAPQVGDCIISGEDEKLNNLFKLLFALVEQRKMLLQEYNGNYELYNENADKKLPLIVLGINNYDAFSENYDNLNELLVTLSRTSVKYGIVIIITATGTNSVRNRLSQNFKQIITLQLNSDIDYVSLIGRTNGLYPSDIYGRGLIKLDSIYEFQMALPSTKDKIYQTVINTCNELSNKYYYKALKVPVLPSKVTIDLFNNYNNTNIPIGIDKESLETISFNFENNYILNVMSLTNKNFNNFVLALNQAFNKVPNNKVIILDPINIITKKENVYNNNFDNVISNINNYLLDSQNVKNSLQLIVLCYNVIKDSMENKDLFDQMVLNGYQKKLSIILVGTEDEFKNVSMESWDKYYNPSIGIWMGLGIDDQYTLKTIGLPKEARNPIKDNFGYVVNKADIHLVKLIESDNNE